ncbi:hypothetical protein BCR43DRAFT_488183 [Syncephalastrum racemosum]|uniref:SH3 domain-containing protein n=1 Tax=Syncephalastrum racemosum TaxID=13706 RepID=A0A1X2HI71_SYNRA|nr:hypothetical protein BCR43DRAFT_488183 [Syncephalastrum racemosum]
MVIPTSVLANAHGLMFIRLYRVGLMLSAKGGTGVIIARLPDGSWSAPSGISMTSLGFGHMAGGEIIDSVIVMNYRGAVKAFLDGGGQLQLGVNASISAGPLGRSADIAASTATGQHIAATYAYSQSKGLCIGYSFEGSKISERRSTNAAFYGRPIPARDILSGAIPPPAQAEVLYQMLGRLGAGPRPGMPFAPKKGSRIQSFSSAHGPPTPSMPPSPYNNGSTSQSIGPSAATGAASSSNSARPSSWQPNGGYEEPPPPYEPGSNAAMYTGSGSKTGAQPSFNGESSSSAPQDFSAGATSSASSPLQQQQQEQYNNNGMVGDQKVPPPMDTKQMIFDAPAQQEQQQSVVVARYDYQGQQPEDLSFQKGDHIIVTRRMGDRQCWWEGEIGTRRGVFPANYTEDLDF